MDEEIVYENIDEMEKWLKEGFEKYSDVLSDDFQFALKLALKKHKEIWIDSLILSNDKEYCDLVNEINKEFEKNPIKKKTKCKCNWEFGEHCDECKSSYFTWLECEEYRQWEVEE